MVSFSLLFPSAEGLPGFGHRSRISNHSLTSGTPESSKSDLCLRFACQFFTFE